MKNEKRTNYDYTIIASVSLSRKEYVLGETKRETGKKQYVTWCCVNKTNYSCGHYLADKDVAMKDMYERAQHEIAYRIDRLSDNIKRGE